MPGKKKKYNARFPPARIKKIMQTDEEVGKVAAAVPVIISRGLELFVESLLTRAGEVTTARHARTLTPAHLKQCIMAEKRFDFLQELVSSIADIGPEGEGEPATPSTPGTPLTPSFPPSTTPHRHTPPPPNLLPINFASAPHAVGDGDSGAAAQVGRGRGRGGGRGRGRGRGRGGQTGQQPGGPNSAPKVPRPRGRPRKVVAAPVAVMDTSDQQDSDDALSLDVDTDEDMASDTDEEVIVAAEHSSNNSSSSSSALNPASSAPAPSSSSLPTPAITLPPPQVSKATPPPSPATLPIQRFGVPEVSGKVGAFQISIGKGYSVGVVSDNPPAPTTTATIHATTSTTTPVKATTTTTTNSAHKPPPPPLPPLHPIQVTIPHRQTTPKAAATIAMAPHSPMTPGTRPIFGVPVPVITSVHTMNSRPPFPSANTSTTAFTAAAAAPTMSEVDEDYDS